MDPRRKQVAWRAHHFFGYFSPKENRTTSYIRTRTVSTLPDLSKEFEDGGWRRQAQFRIPAPTSAPVLPTPELLDSARAKELLQVWPTGWRSSRCGSKPTRIDDDSFMSSRHSQHRIVPPHAPRLQSEADGPAVCEQGTLSDSRRVKRWSEACRSTMCDITRCPYRSVPDCPSVSSTARSAPRGYEQISIGLLTYK